MGFTVSVTGPTGEIGTAAVTALERETAVDEDDVPARRHLVADADVAVHLAL